MKTLISFLIKLIIYFVLLSNNIFNNPYLQELLHLTITISQRSPKTNGNGGNKGRGPWGLDPPPPRN